MWDNFLFLWTKIKKYTTEADKSIAVIVKSGQSEKSLQKSVDFENLLCYTSQVVS